MLLGNNGESRGSNNNKKAVVLILLIGFIGWEYQAFVPQPPKLCGTPGGPPITGPRVKLRDGRYLAYKEHGVPKETAKYKIIFVHGFSSNKHDPSISTSGLVKELGVYFVTFDRQGYGESDPHPQRTIKTTSLDIENLADELGLGPKFYVVGYSMGGLAVWGCLKYIPHRLAGAALLSPVINYWWPSFPANLSAQGYSQQLAQDQWAVWVAHHTPWLVYWWNTQKWFPSSSVMSGKANFTAPDLDIIPKLLARAQSIPKTYSTQQGVFESYHREMMVGFGKWEFDPMKLEDPFVDREGSVHLWHGSQDGLVPASLQRYIATKLPWIHYREVQNAGHLLPYTDDMKDAILRALLTEEK